VNFAQNDVQEYVDASSGYNCTFLCSPACFSPASAMSSPCPPTTPPHTSMPIFILLRLVMGGRDEMIRAMASARVPDTSAVNAKFKPPSCYFITVNLVIFIFDQ